MLKSSSCHVVSAEKYKALTEHYQGKCRRVAIISLWHVGDEKTALTHAVQEFCRRNTVLWIEFPDLDPALYSVKEHSRFKETTEVNERISLHTCGCSCS